MTEEAARRGLIAYDAVCPLVAKVHREVQRHHRNGRHVVLVGHEGHPEIVGTLGHAPAGAVSVIRGPAEVDALPFPADARLALAVQTTYSVDDAAEVTTALHSRFWDVARPAMGDICYATTNRQAAVRAIAARADAMIVAGESFSSNACRLAELAASAGCSAVQRIAGPEELDWSALPRSGSLGITAAASTPETVVGEILEALRASYRLRIEEVSSIEETTEFKRVAIG